jgi:hypothetical protein
MRIRFTLVLMLFALWTAGFGPAAAAQAYDDSGDRVLVSAEQGQAVADFAMQAGPRVRPKPDCSHLVHLLYARAGLIYPYEDSRVLYRGVDDFQRVKTPRPGDLAVWLGHVGIVLSPKEKTFLSSVRSGIIIESWTAPHWARRGRPHFFRYRIGPSANLELLAAIMSDGPAVRSPAIRIEDTQTAGVQTQDLQTQNLQNEVSRNQAARNEAARNEAIQDTDAPSDDARAPRASRGMPVLRDQRSDIAAESITRESTAFVAVIH